MGRQRSWTDQELIKALGQSSSMTEVLKYLGLSNGGATISYLKKQIKRLGKQVPNGRTRKGKAPSHKIPLEEILSNKRPYKSQRLKQRLIEANLKENQCEICSLLPEWQGQELVLQLDHIDGNRNNNQLENLRILCPNCHTQTDTWGFKKRSRVA